MDYKTKHGHATGGRRSKTYRAWQSMLNRCENPKFRLFDRYGGRGISVCSRWHSFDLFLEDMGACPQCCSLDRIDNDGDYTASNCRWADRITQARNTSKARLIEHDGKRLPLAQWAENLNVSRKTLQTRIDRGWSAARALTQTVRPMVQQ